MIPNHHHVCVCVCVCVAYGLRFHIFHLGVPIDTLCLIPCNNDVRSQCYILYLHHIHMS